MFELRRKNEKITIDICHISIFRMLYNDSLSIFVKYLWYFNNIFSSAVCLFSSEKNLLSYLCLSWFYCSILTGKRRYFNKQRKLRTSVDASYGKRWVTSRKRWRRGRGEISVEAVKVKKAGEISAPVVSRAKITGRNGKGLIGKKREI